MSDPDDVSARMARALDEKIMDAFFRDPPAPVAGGTLTLEKVRRAARIARDNELSPAEREQRLRELWADAAAPIGVVDFRRLPP